MEEKYVIHICMYIYILYIPRHELVYIVIAKNKYASQFQI